MGHYRDACAAWAGILRTSEGLCKDEHCAEAVANTAKQVDRCADLATRADDVIVELGAARRSYFEQEEQMQRVQVGCCHHGSGKNLRAGNTCFVSFAMPPSSHYSSAGNNRQSLFAPRAGNTIRCNTFS